MRAAFDLLKLIALGALCFMLFRCDSHLKNKYDTQHPVRETRV